MSISVFSVFGGAGVWARRGGGGGLGAGALSKPYLVISKGKL